MSYRLVYSEGDTPKEESCKSLSEALIVVARKQISEYKVYDSEGTLVNQKKRD